MKYLRRYRTVPGGFMTAFIAVCQMCSPVHLSAATLYWDINQGTANSGTTASGAWDGAAPEKWNSDSTGGAAGTIQAVTTSIDDLFFSSGTGLVSGTITVSTGQFANSITFEETGVYTLNGGDITLSGANSLNFSNTTGANIINTALILSGSTAFTNSDNSTQTLNGGVTGTGNLTLTNNSSGAFSLATGGINNIGTITHTGSSNGTATISAAIGSSVTAVIQNSLTSTLVLSGANSFGSLFIKAGTAQGAGVATTPLFFGTGTITLGDTAPSTAFATLRVGGAVQTYANPILLGSGTTGTLTIVNNNTGSAVTFTGGVTGTNNLVLTANSGAGLNFTTTPVNNAGTITNSSGAATAAVTISSGVGSSVTGVIQNSTTSKFVLSGPNTYNAPTTITLGTLELASGSSLAGSAVNGAAGTTFLVSGNSVIGTAGSPSVTVAGGPSTTGGVLSLLGGVLNTLTINSAGGPTVLTMGGVAGNASQLNMEVGSTADQIILGSGLKASIGAGGVTVNITSLGNLSGTTQTLISAPGGLDLTSGGTFTLTTSSGNFGGHVLGLNTTPTALELTETANATPAAAYWGGALSSVWNTFTGGNTNNSNWLNAPAGTDTNAPPGATTNVFMTADAATNLTTTLGQSFVINSLTFTGAGTAGTAAVSIGGANPLTINATNANGNTAGTGIMKLAGSGADTISAPLILGGNQSWTNNASTALTVSGGVTGTGNLILNNNTTLPDGITLSIASVNHIGTITNSGTSSGTTTISAIIGSNVTGIVQNSATSELRLSGLNTAVYTNGFTVKAGTLFAITSATPFGATSNVITLGDSAINLAATLTVNLASTSPVGNGIVLASGVSAPLTISSPNTGSQATLTGGVTGVNNLVLSATGNNVAGGLRFTNANAVNNTGTITANGTGTGIITIELLGANVLSVAQAGATRFTISSPLALSATNKTLISTGSGLFTLSGGITGAQNLTLNANSTGGITLSTNSVNNTGTITNSGTGTGVSTISGAVGANVTAITENSATSALTISGTTALEVNAAGTTLTNSNSSGSALLTVSCGVSGTGNLILNNNSAITNGVTLSTTSVNNTGTVTNSGTGAGTVTISGGVGANVTAITENSATSALTISGSGLTVNASGTTLTNSNSSGSSILTVSGGVTGTGNLILNNNSAITNGITFSTNSINNTGTVTNSGSGSGMETIGVVIGINVSGVIQNSATSALTLTGTNLYTGSTNVTAGSLILSGTGASNSSSGFSINGSTAKLVQTSTVAIAPTVTLSQGTVDGVTATINTLNVDAAGTAASKVVTAGNGGTGTLTIDTLTFNGAATVNLLQSGTIPGTTLATTNLNADGAAGSVLFNLSNSGLYTPGFYNLITYTTLGAGDFGQFALGSISGLTARQSANLVNSGTAIQLQITGSAASLVWTGAQNTKWTTAVIAPSKNWLNAGNPDDFVAGDMVTFNDTAIGTSPVTVDISDANVTPTSTTFNNSTKDYILQTSGTFGIAGNSTLIKAGTGNLTINNTNTYSGATTIQNGTVIAGIDNALPVTTNLILGNNLAGGSSTQGILNLATFNQTVSSLTVQSDSAIANQIVIGNGKTLTVNGNVVVGELNGSKTTPKLIMSGGGTLSVINNAPGAVFQVGANDTQTTTSGNNATVDLSGLSTVNISLNTTNGAVNIGDNVGNNANSGVSSSLFLPTTGAGNTTITAATISVGPQGRNSTTTPFVNVLKLGSGANVFNVTNFNIGGVATGGSGIRDAGSVTFTNGSGTIRLRDTTGTGRANLNIAANPTANTAAVRTNTFDVSGHDADLLIGTLTIGDGSGGTGAQTNLFSFDTGILDVSTILLAKRTGTGASASIFSTTVNFGSSPASTGMVNVGAGGITLLNQANTSATSRVVSTLNILGGTVAVGGDIFQTVTGTGLHTGTLNLDGGTLNMNGNRIGGAVAANNIDALVFKSGTLMNVAGINNGGGLTKTSTGTLILEGTNTYTGATIVSAGNLQVGRISLGTTGASSAVTVNGSGAVLSGTGTVQGSTTVTQGTIRPGDTGGTAVGTLNLQGGLTFNPTGASTVAEFTINGTTISNETGDLINVTGALTLNSDSNFVVTNGGSWTPTIGQSWTLVNWTSLIPGTWSAGTNLRTGNNAGLNEGNLDLVDITGTGVWDISQFTTNGTISIVAVPEPGRALLILLGLMALAFRRRR